MRKRAKVHRDAAGQGRGALIGAAIRKYGKDNIKFEVLAVCPSWEYAKETERLCIAAFKPEYNLTAGGDGCLGYRHTEVSKAHLRKINKGRQPWLGKQHHPSTKAKMSAARAAYWLKNPRPKKFYVPKGAPKRGRRVLCNDVIYESVVHAAKANGLTRDQLKMALERKKNPGSILGLQFCYYGGNQLELGQNLGEQRPMEL